MMEAMIIIIEKTGADHFYIQWKHDFRGRLYPKSSLFSHVGHKYLRPLFILHRDFKITTGPFLAYNAGKITTLPDPFINYVKVLQALDIKTVNNSLPLRDEYMKYVESELIKFSTPSINFLPEADYDRINRLLELHKLMTEGSVTPAPLQLDATCNVIQHFSRIVGNEEVAKIVGLSTEKRERDFYTTIANKTIEILKNNTINSEEIEATESDQVLTQLQESGAMGKLRRIVKKPAITKAYAAKFITAIQSVKEECSKLGVTLTPSNLKTFTRAIITALNTTITKESELMKTLSSLAYRHKDSIS